MRRLDEKYWKIIKYVVLGVALVYSTIILLRLGFDMIFNMSSTISSISGGFGIAFKILAPFLIGVIFAYLVDPLVEFFQDKYEKFEDVHLQGRKKKKLEKLQKKGIEIKHRKRMAGTAILYLIIVAILGIIVMVILHSIDLSNSSDVPITTYVVDKVTATAQAFTKMNDTIQQKLVEIGVSSYFLSIVESVFGWVKGLTASIVSIVLATFQGVVTGFIGLVIGFYLLVDKEMFKDSVLRVMNVFIPDKTNTKILEVSTATHNVFSGYIRGQLMDACIYGTMIGIALSILGVPYSLVIGVISGFCNLIPYVGAFVAFTMSITFALFSGNPMLAVYAAITIFILQQVDSVFVQPRCVASKIDISPLLVIVSLTVCGSIFGVIGMLIAVPVTSLIKLFLTQFVDSQERSGKIKSFLTRDKNKN